MVDYVYFSCHNHPLEHWFLLVLDINIRTLMLYDSMKGNGSHDIEVHKTIKPMVKFLPHVLDVYKCFQGEIKSSGGNAPLRLKVCDKFP